MKTQELRLLVFLTRYLDLFTTFYSLYNSIVKFEYILATAAIIVGIKFMEPIKSVYNVEQDPFPHWKFCVVPCTVLASGTHLIGSGIEGFNFVELLWTFSIYLESVSILPQLMTLRKYRLVENLTGRFVFFLGLYRFLYIFNWIYRANTEKYYRHHWVVYICGVVQTLLYVDFFYQYSRVSRLCLFARGTCLDRRSDNVEYTSSNNKEADDTSLIFELSSSPKYPRMINADAEADTTEPLIVISEESQQLKTGIEGLSLPSGANPPLDDIRRRVQEVDNTEV